MLGHDFVQITVDPKFRSKEFLSALAAETIGSFDYLNKEDPDRHPLAYAIAEVLRERGLAK